MPKVKKIVPNCLCAVSGYVLRARNHDSGAPFTAELGHSFSVTPGNGAEPYSVCAIVCSPEQGDTFGFTSLRINRCELVRHSQALPVAPISNAVPWTAFVRGAFDEPVFDFASYGIADPSTPITGTIVNMTLTGSYESRAFAPKIAILVRTWKPSEVVSSEGRLVLR